MKPILAATVAMTSLLAGAAHTFSADPPFSPNVIRPTIPPIALDCSPRHIFCVHKVSKNAEIHILRCRTEDTASCALAGERPIPDFSPDAKILKVMLMRNGCLQLTIRGFWQADHSPSAGR